MSLAMEEIPLRGMIPMSIREIEITYIDGREPTVSLMDTIEPSSPAKRPSEPMVNFLSLFSDGQPFGDCTYEVEQTALSLKLVTHDVSDGPCGYVLPFRSQDAPLDSLSFDTLHIRGQTAGRATIALVDEAAQRREENIPLVTVAGDFDIRISLRSVARQLDLRRLLSVVVLLEKQTTSFTLNTLILEQASKLRQTASGLGFWLWQYREAITNSDKVLEECRRAHCTRLFIQMPAMNDASEVWAAYVQFLRAAQDKGIEAFALDGFPEAVYHPEALVEKVRRLRAVSGDKDLVGVQLDVEPYLLDGFFVDDTGFVRYLELIDSVKAAMAGKGQLSIVMPFWLSSAALRGRPVAFSVMDRVDEVAIMSYRTDVQELQAIAEDTLRYGDLVGVPVWLAVETIPLPMELHVILKREARRELATAYLDRGRQHLVLEPPPSSVDDRDWFRVHHRTPLRPERITFAGQSRGRVVEAVTTILQGGANRSLAGVIIHHLRSFLALPQE